MPSKTYKTRALVVRKTKLGEKDLIVSMVDEDGSLVRGVAKGARKPGGSLAARLELFSMVDVFMAQGKNLDVICEARLIEANAPAYGIEQSACAAPIAELLCSLAQPDLAQPRIFDMARSAFRHLSILGAHPKAALAVSAACLWKLMSQSGYRPSFTTCVQCGRDAAREMHAAAVVSLADGGVICHECRKPADAIAIGPTCLRWCETLIRSRFEEVTALRIDERSLFDALHLVRAWIRTHTGRNLKSLDFLLSSGLF